MNAKVIGLGIVLLAFLDFTIYAVYQHGYLGFFEAVGANSATGLAMLDLTIALTLIVVWMVRDARASIVEMVQHSATTWSWFA